MPRRRPIKQPSAGRRKPSRPPAELHLNRVKKSRFVISALIGANSIATLGLALHHFYALPAVVYASGIYLYMVMILVLGLFFMPYPPRSYGFQLEQWKSDLRFALIMSAVLVTVALVSRYLLVRAGFDQFRYVPPANVLSACLSVVLYVLATLVQEAVMRGYFQSYFVAVFEKGPMTKPLAIVLSSLVFAQFHLIYNLPFAGIAFTFSLVLGAYYEVHRSLLGVVIIHASSGMAMIFFSGF